MTLVLMEGFDFFSASQLSLRGWTVSVTPNSMPSGRFGGQCAEWDQGNSSPDTLLAVKSSGSDSARWTVSLDNVSFASSQSISSLAPGATQVVYFKFTPPSPGSGVYRPYAGYLEADVTSWS